MSGIASRSLQRALLPFLLLSTACADRSEQTVAAASTTAASTATAPAPSPSPSPTLRLRDLNLGDRACYLLLETDSGDIREAMAVSELCERVDLIGQPVRLLSAPALVTAASCEGDPECSDSETVDLVQQIEVVNP